MADGRCIMMMEDVGWKMYDGRWTMELDKSEDRGWKQ